MERGGRGNRWSILCHSQCRVTTDTTITIIIMTKHLSCHCANSQLQQALKFVIEWRIAWWDEMRWDHYQLFIRIFLSVFLSFFLSFVTLILISFVRERGVLYDVYLLYYLFFSVNVAFLVSPHSRSRRTCSWSSFVKTTDTSRSDWKRCLK
jgi:hypothetical protein